ncbi:MAG TPA: hypothetical protein VGG19_16530, partial [Tepidisphaeraceae bacterium]
QSFKIHGTLPPTPRYDLITALTNLEVYAHLRANLPASISEAKSAPNGWQQLPLFATPLALHNHRAEVMQQVGLNPNDAGQSAAFENAQTTAIAKMRGM